MCTCLGVQINADDSILWNIFLKVELLYPKYIHFKKNVNVYLFFRDRVQQTTSRGGAEREGDTESEAGSRL